SVLPCSYAAHTGKNRSTRRGRSTEPDRSLALEKKCSQELRRQMHLLVESLGSCRIREAGSHLETRSRLFGDRVVVRSSIGPALPACSGSTDVGRPALHSLPTRNFSNQVGFGVKLGDQPCLVHGAHHSDRQLFGRDE